MLHCYKPFECSILLLGIDFGLVAMYIPSITHVLRLSTHRLPRCGTLSQNFGLTTFGSMSIGISSGLLLPSRML